MKQYTRVMSNNMMVANPINSKPENTILFTGDTVYNSRHWDHIPLSADIVDDFEGSDLIVTNLEAPIKSGTPTDKYGSSLHTSEEAIEDLSELGFDLFCLANNHIMDYGLEGLTSTLEVCRNAGIDTVGAGLNKEEAVDPRFIQLGNCSIAIFSVTQREFGIAESDKPGAAWIGSPNFIREVTKASRKCDVVIVNAHGGLEYIPVPPTSWAQKLRELVDVGADLVIGHHPHVPQGWEEIEDSYIFYSLGNWLFDMEKPDLIPWAYYLEVALSEDGLVKLDITITEQEGGKLRMACPSSVRKRKTYLSKSNKYLGNEEYWQVLAGQLFDNQYRRHLSDWALPRYLSIFSHPVLVLDRITRGISTDKVRKEKDLIFLNYLLTESHTDAIRTELESRIRAGESRPTDNIESELNDMTNHIVYSEDKGTIVRNINRVRKAISRFIS